jgi:hypothetical protein
VTTATVIIQAALREGNLIPAGKSPTTAEQTEALERLNRLVSGVFGYELGENLSDWMAPTPQRTAPVAANYPQGPLLNGIDAAIPFNPQLDVSQWPYPPPNSRIVFGRVTSTVYFPEAPSDGARMAVVMGSGAGDGGDDGEILTLDGNGRTIEGANTLELTTPFPARSWFYRADLADWLLIEDVALEDEMLFPSELDDAWICGLAIRLAPRYSKATAVETATAYKNAMGNLKTQYRQDRVTTYGGQQIPNAAQSYAPARNWQG